MKLSRPFSAQLDASGTPYCFLAVHGVQERPMGCQGRLVRAHLIPQQLLKSLAEYKALKLDIERQSFLYDPATWVWACGGITGCSGHHGAMDVTRSLRLPRAAIPTRTEVFAYAFGLDWYLDRTYGTAG